MVGLTWLVFLAPLRFGGKMITRIDNKDIMDLMLIHTEAMTTTMATMMVGLICTA